jgi:peptide/nickel transport system permease protein
MMTDVVSMPVKPARASDPSLAMRILRGFAKVELIPLAVLILVAIVGPSLTRYNPEKVVGSTSSAPNGKFWFGTDSTGLDVFSQTLAATRTDVLLAFSGTGLATFFGVMLGLVIGMCESSRGAAGYFARGVGRLVDFVQAVPAIILGLVVVSLYGASRVSLVLAIAVILLPIQIRLVRTEVLRVRGEAYLDAARIAGTGEIRLTLRHVMPNSSWVALENVSVLYGVSVILTAALGFLGVGIPPPAPEWGSIIARGATDANNGRWWSALFPCIFLGLSVAAVAMAAATLKERKR